MDFVYKRTKFISDIVGFYYESLVIMHNYAPEDLILYLYKETSPEATTAIENALKEDWTLREKLAVLKTSMERLNGITVSPRTEIVLNVLRAARENVVVTSK